MLEWAFECLLKNSIDAMPNNGGKIDLRISRKSHQAIIEVEDSGSGISDADKSHIFDPGFTTKRSGRGVGLPLARHILEEVHGGKLDLVSSIQDQGTTFRITMNTSSQEEAP